jgi:hypothetical protein
MDTGSELLLRAIEWQPNCFGLVGMMTNVIVYSCSVKQLPVVCVQCDFYPVGSEHNVEQGYHIKHTLVNFDASLGSSCAR